MDKYLWLLQVVVKSTQFSFPGFWYQEHRSLLTYTSSELSFPPRPTHIPMHVKVMHLGKESDVEFNQTGMSGRSGTGDGQTSQYILMYWPTNCLDTADPFYSLSAFPHLCLIQTTLISLFPGFHSSFKHSIINLV